MTVSVIIPTYRRPKQLLRALKSIQNQTFETFELIVVDNNANLKIREMIRKFNHHAKHIVRYIPEPELGLHNARHTGVRESFGDILILLEDEITFSPDFLKSYVEAFKTHKQMVVAGGPLKAKWASRPPKWLLDLIGNSKIFPPLSLMEPYENFNLSKKNFFFGGNMAIKKKVLYEIVGFNPDTTGTILLGNGDVGLNRKIWKNGYLVGYIPGALVYHHIDKKRMSVEALRHWMGNEGRCDMYTIFYEKGVPRNLFGLINTGIIGTYLYISLKYWIGNLLLKGHKAPLGLKIQLQWIRTKAQLGYISMLINDKNLQKLVSQKNWL